jgi:hypothetical protein
MQRYVKLLVNEPLLAGLETQHLAEPGIPRNFALFRDGVLDAVKAVGLFRFALAVLPELTSLAIPALASFQDIEDAPLIDLVAALARPAWF